MSDKSCYNCKYQDSNGNMDIRNVNCANCLLNGSFMGFESKRIVNKDKQRRISTSKLKTINLLILFAIIILSSQLISLLFFKVVIKFFIFTVTLIVLLALCSILIVLNRGEKF